jgi:hypothetical protein
MLEESDHTRSVCKYALSPDTIATLYRHFSGSRVIFQIRQSSGKNTMQSQKESWPSHVWLKPAEVLVLLSSAVWARRLDTRGEVKPQTKNDTMSPNDRNVDRGTYNSRSCIQ